MSNLPSVTFPVWQTKHLARKIGSISAPYSTGSFRFRSIGMIGTRSFLGSCAEAASLNAARARSVRIVSVRMEILGWVGLFAFGERVRQQSESWRGGSVN